MTDYAELVPMVNGLEPRQFLRLLKCPDCGMDLEPDGFGMNAIATTHHYDCPNPFCWVGELHLSVHRDQTKRTLIMEYLKDKQEQE